MKRHKYRPSSRTSSITLTLNGTDSVENQFPSATINEVPLLESSPIPKNTLTAMATTANSVMKTMVVYFILALCFSRLISAHVVLVHPTPRTDNDYLFTFDDGVCNPDNTCASFCGDAYDPDANPTTLLRVGVPITLRWKTNVVHEPLRYRLSLNFNHETPTPTDDSSIDSGFDLGENVLATVDNAEAADPTNVGKTGTFSTTVTIPESALETCGVASKTAAGGQPCVLQLWDLYYFVSCANVWLTTEDIDLVEDVGEPLLPSPTPVPLLVPSRNPNNTTILFRGASFDDYWVTLGTSNQPELDPVLYLERCKEYTFFVDAPGHPLVLKTAPGVGPDNVLVVGDDGVNNYADGFYSVGDSFPTKEGMERGSFVFWVGDKAPSKGLFYQCTLHENMVSEIVLVDGDCGVSSASPSAGPSSGPLSSPPSMEPLSTSSGERPTTKPSASISSDSSMPSEGLADVGVEDISSASIPPATFRGCLSLCNILTTFVVVATALSMSS